MAPRALENCVKTVFKTMKKPKDKSKKKSSAYAVCTSSLKKAGKI